MIASWISVGMWYVSRKRRTAGSRCAGRGKGGRAGSPEGWPSAAMPPKSASACQACGAPCLPTRYSRRRAQTAERQCSTQTDAQTTATDAAAGAAHLGSGDANVERSEGCCQRGKLEGVPPGGAVAGRKVHKLVQPPSAAAGTAAGAAAGGGTACGRRWRRCCPVSALHKRSGRAATRSALRCPAS